MSLTEEQICFDYDPEVQAVESKSGCGDLAARWETTTSAAVWSHRSPYSHVIYLSRNSHRLPWLDHQRMRSGDPLRTVRLSLLWGFESTQPVKNEWNNQSLDQWLDQLQLTGTNNIYVAVLESGVWGWKITDCCLAVPLYLRSFTWHASEPLSIFSRLTTGYVCENKNQ